MGTPAQFTRRTQIDHTNLVAVFFAKQRHGPQGLGLVHRHDATVGSRIGEDLGIDDGLDTTNFLASHRGMMRKVKSGARRIDQ